MKKNNNQRKVKIISEIHPQHLGSIDEAKRMILYSKLGGADFVKVQLYDSKLLFNNNLRSYIQLSKKEFFDLNSYSNQIGIENLLHFDKSKIDCEEAGINFYKIASRTVKDKKLCKEILSLNKSFYFTGYA